MNAKIVYTYNPFDTRIDKESLLFELGTPTSSSILNRGIIQNIYINVTNISNDGWNVIRETNLSCIDLSSFSKTEPTPQEYKSFARYTKFVVSKVTGEFVKNVITTTFVLPQGYVISNIPVDESGYIYPSSNEESLLINRYYIDTKYKPLFNHPIFHYHSIAECILSDSSFNKDLFIEDALTYMIPSVTNHIDRDEIRELRDIAINFNGNGYTCLPRIREDPRVNLYIEMAKQFGMDVTKSDNKSILIANEDSNIQGHLWFEENAQRILDGKLPLYTFYIDFEMISSKLAEMKYIVISSYLNLCNKYNILYNYVEEVNVDYMGNVTIPIASKKQLDIFMKTFNEYIQAEPIFSVFEYKTKEKLLLNRWYFQQKGYPTLTFEIDNSMFLIGMFDEIDLQTQSDISFYYDSLFEAYKDINSNGEDMFDNLFKELNTKYEAVTGIVNFGIFKGLIDRTTEEETINVTKGNVYQEMESIVQIVYVEVENTKHHLFSLLGKDNLSEVCQKLWNKAFFMNNWAKQYYIDTGNISSKFLAKNSILSEGYDKDKVISYLNEKAF